jgi:hypothetical protein
MLDSRRTVVKVVLPFHVGDAHLANDLLVWCRDLGGCPNHDAILIADVAVQWSVAHDLLRLAQSIFRQATILTTPQPETGWPVAANIMWLFAARHIEQKVKDRWLWLEPDCVPLKSGWLDTLSTVPCHKPFMGPVIQAQLNGRDFTYMNGVSIYPPNAASLIEPLLTDPEIAWDVAATQVMLANGINTPLIFCWWGLPDLPPSFARQSTAPHIKTLDWLPKEAVLFHRCKDGSLITLLRERLCPSPLVVVLPFCNKDGETLLRTLGWMATLHGKVPYDALLCYPSDTLQKLIDTVRKWSGQLFHRVNSLSYRGSSTDTWPAGANTAWQAAANRMAIGNLPWLFLEPDAIPLAENWLDQLVARYRRAGKPFMGSIVPGLGHMNGVGIYPADAARRCPKAMSARGQAWDWIMREEMIRDCHDAGDLIFHFWGVVNGKPHPFQGDAPHFAKIDDVRRWIPRGTVLVHRNKDNSLVARLHENFHPDRVVSQRPALVASLLT